MDEEEANPPFTAECVHCHRIFRASEGHISEEVSICDLCLGDD